ncbi:hypothetical protein [Archangium violaceum]|uniref:hypothetical protein n=1 Tax=Archangium violaceum TaxID=83451 RepID=UPI001F1FA7B6|nr:hypothetical protein [Archangium violaceum]
MRAPTRVRGGDGPLVLRSHPGTRAELLRPGANAWEPAGQTVRVFHPGPVCVSGERVIIAGGRDNGSGFAIIEGVHIAPPLDQGTEIWEPHGRTWRMSGPLTRPRDEAKGVTLSDGRVLVVGGCRSSARPRGPWGVPRRGRIQIHGKWGPGDLFRSVALGVLRGSR